MSSRGWKTLQQLYSLMLGFFIIHMIDIHYNLKINLKIYVSEYTLIQFLCMHIATFVCHLFCICIARVYEKIFSCVAFPIENIVKV